MCMTPYSYDTPGYDPISFIGNQISNLVFNRPHYFSCGILLSAYVSYMGVIVGSLLVHSVGSGYNRQLCGATYIGSNYQLSPKRACAQCTHFFTTDGLML